MPAPRNRYQQEGAGVLAGRKALVTGATSGIGYDVAVRFALEGASVALFARRKKSLTRLAHKITDCGGNALPIACDVTDPVQVAESAGRVEDDFGGIDIVVNCAGVLIPGPFESTSLASFRRMIDVNFYGALHVTKAALPAMRRAGGGNIVNIASIAGRHGMATLAGYSASKFAVIGLTEALRTELFGSGVVASLVVPGSVDTPMLENHEWRSRSWTFGGLKMPPSWVTWGVIAAVLTGAAEIEVPPGIVTAQKVATLFPDITSAWLGLGFRTVQLVNGWLERH